ncbi:MAG TPA: FAD-dependent oxidoreductase [Casimicrobiaceae bacterium]|jgi:NADPH-dependent 2,4-dienoyl-CoA reductase/sulfur reductase-like enzyme
MDSNATLPAECELAIVGAGAAGMAAAALAASLGVDTVLVDEQEAPGGAMYRGLTRATASRISDADYTRGIELIDAIDTAKLRFAGATRVCGISRASDGFELCVASRGHAQIMRARAVVLATGAMERVLPIPGAALAGVTYAGAMLCALKLGAGAPAGRVVLAGCGPLLYVAAKALRAAGAEVVALLDTLSVRHFMRALPQALAFMRSPYYASGAKLLREVNDNVPIYHDVEEFAALGNDKLASVRFRAGNRAVTLIADALVVHHGVVPDVQLADMLGCALSWDDRVAAWVARVDVWGMSSIAGAFVAGDGGGVAGARAAEHRGRIAALGAASSLGHIDVGARDAAAEPHRHALSVAMRGRRFIDRVYLAPPRFRVPDGDTIVCGCENVSARQVIELARQGCAGPNQMKAYLRCGMGACQGRDCGLIVTELIAREQRVHPGRVGRFHARFPARPMSLAELASLPSTEADRAAVARMPGADASST